MKALAMILTGVSLVCIGICYGFDLHKSLMQREAIQRGFAEYNPTNGVWQWKGSK